MFASVFTIFIVVMSMVLNVAHGDNSVHDHGDNYGALINFIVNTYRNNETISELLSKVRTLEEMVANLVSERDSSIKGSTESTYVRWGRTTCPGNGSDLLYAGYMAGTYYHPFSNPNSGHGGNYICLPYRPSWNHYSYTKDNLIVVTGVEYDMYPHHTSDISDFFGSNIHGQQASCSVCRSNRLQVMIPGRSGCYDGWTIEYTGYLVTGSPSYNDGTEYVCMDLRPEHAGGSTDHENKNKLYLVETNSDFGLNEFYTNGRELACVVCSI